MCIFSCIAGFSYKLWRPVKGSQHACNYVSFWWILQYYGDAATRDQLNRDQSPEYWIITRGVSGVMRHTVYKGDNVGCRPVVIYFFTGTKSFRQVSPIHLMIRCSRISSPLHDLEVICRDLTRRWVTKILTEVMVTKWHSSSPNV